MINIEILLIVLGGLCVVLLGVLVKKLSKVKVWVESRQKDNQPFVCTCYLEKGEDGEAAEVHRSGAFGKPAVAIVKVDEKSTLNRGYVDVLMTDMNDDAEKPHYRRTGFVSFDQDTTVDQYGYIYKQIKGKKEKEVIGYLARPSKPNEPTIYGERSWKTPCCMLMPVCPPKKRATRSRVNNRRRNPRNPLNICALTARGRKP